MYFFKITVLLFLFLPMLNVYSQTLAVHALAGNEMGQKSQPLNIVNLDPSVLLIDSVRDTLKIKPEQDLILADEVVITATMKPVSKLDSPIPVEVYSSNFFRCNPTPSVFEATAHINGVRPQINCNVCNTGDIHINGLEGPYTMVLIDGMPIVSGLSTVYGLSGIPQALIDRVEVVKGPASTLYGSEAVGGIVNVITKSPTRKTLFAADIFGTSMGELNTDVSLSLPLGKNVKWMGGINFFGYSNPLDHNKDGFTDVTLQKRGAFFNKMIWTKENRQILSLAGRLVFEDRWGGDLMWTPEFRGTDSIYGESILTKRWELLGKWRLPVKENISFAFSATGHDQDSWYGDLTYLANQTILFSQLIWDKKWGQHDFLLGQTFRYTGFDDNTGATGNATFNVPSRSFITGLFIQDEWKFDQLTVLGGIRYDFDNRHGSILSPRINFKWQASSGSPVVRFGYGNGFRVVNVFTEDHAALTGARQVVFSHELNPEKSDNLTLNTVIHPFRHQKRLLSIDVSGFFTRFSNKIIADYETHSDQIIYANLDGYAISKGLSVNIDSEYKNFRLNTGMTLMDVYSVEENVRIRQLFTERYSATWTLGWTAPNRKMTLSYTGNLYSPMRLPLVSPLDPRPSSSPWFSIQNIQTAWQITPSIEIYGGIKNLFDRRPTRGIPFLIARTNDPFDKLVIKDQNGLTQATPDNPYGMTFDPTYVYTANQGIRGFLGFRYNLIDSK